MDAATKADLDRMLETFVGRLEAIEMRWAASSRMRNGTVPNHIGQGRAGSQDQQRFERFEARLETFENRVDATDAREGRFEVRLAGIADRLASTAVRLSTLTLRVERLAVRIETLTRRVVTVGGRSRAPTQRVEGIEAGLLALKSRVDDLADDMRRRFRVLK